MNDAERRLVREHYHALIKDAPDQKPERRRFDKKYQLEFFLHIIKSPQWRRSLLTSEGRKFLFSREQRTGLLEGSIIQNPLYIPQGRQLEFQSALAGQYAGYDFRRTAEFGNDARQLHKGKLLTFPLEEIADNEPDVLTPSQMFNSFYISHVLTATYPTIDEAVAQGMLQQTTYRDAFMHHNRYGWFAPKISALELADKPLYQVTPKGNGLVFLLPNSGDEKQPEAAALLDYALATR